MRHKATSATTVKNGNTVCIYDDSVQKKCVRKNLIRNIKKCNHCYHLTAITIITDVTWSHSSPPHRKPPQCLLLLLYQQEIMNIHQSPVQVCEILWINHAIWQIKLLPQKKGMTNTGNPANTHLSLKDFKHLNNFCKILPFWVLNLMLEFHIELTHQISAVIDCSFSIVVHILMIKKNSNFLLSFSMLLCFN